MKLPKLYQLLSNELQTTGATVFMLDDCVVYIDANYTNYNWTLYNKLGEPPIDIGVSELSADNLIAAIIEGRII